MSNFHPLEAVGRGSEPQLQVGENLNSSTYTLITIKGWSSNSFLGRRNYNIVDPVELSSAYGT